MNENESHEGNTSCKDSFLRYIQGENCKTKTPVNVVRLTHDGNYCLTAGEDRSIRLYNPHKSDYCFIDKATASGTTSERKVEKALFIKTYSGAHGYPILDVVVSQDKSKFASAGDDRSFFLWDVTSGNVIRRFQGHSQKVNSLAMNVDGTVLITASNDQTVKCWDLRSNNR